ncbi:MAG: hypothetical protein OXH29_08070 [bacterium]|nr:hypothetical protein [bacterium]
MRLRFGPILVASALAFSAVVAIPSPVGAQEDVSPDGASEEAPSSTDTSEQPPIGRFSAVAAGSRHVCGLTTDQTITCWGYNDFQQANAPDGQFTAITAGDEHGCALTTDARVICWGDNSHGQTNAPDGQFTAITASAWNSCALTTDARVICWGSNHHGQTNAPDGQFTAITAGSSFACGLTTDQTITCWGDNSHGQTNAPDGQFTAITASVWHSCGLRTDARVICWGVDRSFRNNVPAELFNAIGVGRRHSCGLTTDQTITCWGNSNYGQIDAPDGQFTAITARGEQSCALTTDQTITCWGNSNYGQIDAPDGQFTAITAGDGHTCAIATDQTITCWGNNENGQANAPRGQFAAVAAGAWHTCALHTTGAVTCWGDNGFGQAGVPFQLFSKQQTSVPFQLYTAIAAGARHTCGLATDQTITCWGDNSHGQTNAPDGQFTATTAGARHTCAVAADQAVTCWGDNGAGQADVPYQLFNTLAAGNRHTCGLGTDQTITCWGHGGRPAEPPEGQFSALAAGNRHSCGLRTDQTITCWSLTPTVPAPSETQQALQSHLPNPDLCRPHGVSHHITAGFPLPSWAPLATGTVRVAVLFLDFPDAAAAHSTQEEAELGLPYAKEYLKSASYGQLDIEFVPLHRWLRAENSYTYYLRDSFLGYPLLRGTDSEAVRLADPEFDFTGIDIVMVVTPSSHFASAADAGGMAYTDEGMVAPTSRINIALAADRPRDPGQWGSSAAHELAHNLGLLDYYAYDDSHTLPESPVGKTWAHLSFGLMGLRAFFLTNTNDPRMAITWHFPSGHRQANPHYFFTAREMLAWSRWQLGWLADSQIRCVTDPDATIDLRPVAAGPGDGIAMAAIPLSDTEVIVIESRRRIGHDIGIHHRTSDGISTTFPALAGEGVLVYTVNAALGSGRLPLKVAGDTGNGQVDGYPVLAQGQSVTIRGYTITVQTVTTDVHTVAIAKAESA